MDDGNSELMQIERVPKEKIVQVKEVYDRGTLVRRVSPNGRVMGETMLVTGAYVLGVPSAPDFVKSVFARTLIRDKNGNLEISSEVPLQFDPDLTVEKVGEIDYLDPKNEKFFEKLEILEERQRQNR